MIRASILIVLVATLIGLVAAGEQEIFLPPDCDVLKIVGNGFKLELSQFEDIKKDFKQVEEESSKVDSPRQQEGSNSATGAESGTDANGDQDSAANEKSVVNEHLFERTKSEEAGKDYGFVEDDLMRWISDRATSLLNRIQRYNTEIGASSGPNRIVLDILLLNTLVDLDNLIKEEVFALRWVKNKLQRLLTSSVHKAEKEYEVETFVVALIDKNRAIEANVAGRNEPGRSWVTNTQAIKRVLHEQRFSSILGEMIVEYLAGRFSMMKRSVVYEINRQPKQLDDGLYYAGARGRVPADFPFSAQDAISHGAYN